jgi:uncharacterized protein YlbG (UPF0298 family)
MINDAQLIPIKQIQNDSNILSNAIDTLNNVNDISGNIIDISGNIIDISDNAVDISGNINKMPNNYVDDILAKIENLKVVQHINKLQLVFLNNKVKKQKKQIAHLRNESIYVCVGFVLVFIILFIVMRKLFNVSYVKFVLIWIITNRLLTSFSTMNWRIKNDEINIQ